MNRKLVNLLTLVALILSLAPVTSVLAAPPVQAGGKVYTIQKDDWLSKLSDKEYGDVLAYPAIVYFNNLKASEDRTFTFIDNPDVLEVGWVLYIPSAEEATGFLSVMSGGLPGVDPLAVTGNIVTAGSSTVFPLSEAVAERFKDEGYAGNITIDSIGSGAGFERFCKTGETDVSNASRRIKAEEIANCQAIGRNPVEFRIGTDALAVTVSKENTFLKNITLAELAKVFSQETTKWSDVNPAWPNENILRFSPGTDSGTFDYFVEAVMNPVYTAGPGEENLLKSANLQLSEDDNVLVQGVEGSPYAIGYFGYAYYQENQDRLNVLSIEGVTPSAQTVDSNEYPLARPLFIYSDANIMQQKPQVAAFINYYLTNVDDVISDVGYFPASDVALASSRMAWMNATGQ